MRTTTWTLALALAACNGKTERPPLEIDTVETTDDSAPIDTGTVPPDGNDALSTAVDQTATALDATATLLAEDVINPAGDNDYVRVHLSAGELYFFWVDSGVMGAEPGDLDSVLTLLNDAGDELTVGDDMIYLLYRYDAGLFFSPTVEGDYTLLVQEYGDYAGRGAEGGPGLTYGLYGTTLGPVEATDVGNSAEEASPLPLDANLPFTDLPAFYGKFTADNDEDWFSFTVPADAEDPALYWVSLWYGFEPLSPEVAVVNAEGTTIAYSADAVQDALGANGLANGPDHGLVFRTTPGETYYVRVSDTTDVGSAEGIWVGTWGQVLDYGAEPADEGGDQQADAYELTNAVQPDTTADFYTLSNWGWLEASTGVDWFKINGADLTSWNGAFLSVWLRATTVGSSVDAKITAYDAEGNSIGESVEDTFSGTPDPLLIDVPADGDVFLKVEAETVDDPSTARGYLIEALSSDAAIGG